MANINPKISVIMSVYNTQEDWLRLSIESILNQTFKDFEFVIIDDGSTNNAQDVILSYRDNRIKYVKQKNQGLANSLNNGLDIAKGEYVARMDSDDISLAERFEKQVNFLDNNKDVSIVGSWFEMFPETKIIKHPKKPKYFDFIKHCRIAHPTVMFRRADFEKYNLRYNPEYKCEDYELWSRAIRYLKFANIEEVLLKYRWHNNNLSKPTEEFLACDKKIKNNMLNFLTDDEFLKQKINNIAFMPKTERKSFLENIFSIKNEYSDNICRKIITILGIQIKYKKNRNNRIIRLMGGLGNQMFQYAFGQALQKATGEKVIYDISWFKNSQATVVNDKNENSNGVVMRKYALDIFYDLSIQLATDKELKKCKKKIIEKKEFEFDPDLLKKQKLKLYEGYFQNEGYLKNIKEQIKRDFKFPKIPSFDEYNQNWLNKIKNCENPVFIHLRRGDYVNLGWNLSTDYYKKAINYIKNNVQNPTFFVFGQDCEDYIKKEFNFDIPFEIIGEENSKNKQDWKDIVLMEQCRHAIIANSTFSWWAAWLGRANEQGIVVAPSPFVNGKDGIICNNWVKIER